MPIERLRARARGDAADPPRARRRGNGPVVPPLRTARLELVSMSLPFMEALAAHDVVAAATEVGATVPEDLPDQLVHFLVYRLAQVRADPSIRAWLGRVMVLTDESGARHVIGTLGFHGPPDQTGRAEVGYRIQPEYRRQGYTIEAVRALFDWALREHGIRRFVASISPTNDPSLSLVAKLGFQQVGSQMDEIDGLELIFEATWPPA